MGEDGETHQGIFDVAFLNTIPGVTIYSPSCYEELRINLRQAIYDDTGIAAVRYPKGGELPGLKDYKPEYKPYKLIKTTGARVLLITYGRIFANVKKAADRLCACGCPVSVLKLTRIKPLDLECAQIAASYDCVFFFEEGIRYGGVGEAFGNMLINLRFAGNYELTAINGFVPMCSIKTGLKNHNLDAESIANTVQARQMEIERERKWARTI